MDDGCAEKVPCKCDGDEKPDIIRFWDSIASDYTKRYNACLDLPQWIDSVIDSTFHGNNGLWIADIGTGAASVTRALSKMGHKVIATDISEQILSNAIAMTDISDVQATFINDDITDSRLSNDFFDIVLLKDLLFTISRPERALRNAMRILRPGGLLVITDGNFIQHNHFPEYQQRASYYFMKDGRNEAASFLRLSDEQFEELEGLVKDYEVNRSRRPQWDVMQLIDMGANNIRIMNDINSKYTYLTENGSTSIPLKFVLMAEKPSQTSIPFFGTTVNTGHPFIRTSSSAILGNTFSALGNPYRVKLVKTLLNRPKNVKELSAIVELNENKTCYHLNILKDAGIVEGDKVGREVFYRITNISDTRNLLEFAARLKNDGRDD